MIHKIILKIFVNSFLWSLFVFAVTYIIFNINTLFQESSIIHSAAISIATFCTFFILSTIEAQKTVYPKRRKNINENYFKLFLAIAYFLVTWYIFIGQSWETEKAEKIVSIVLTWPSVALIVLILFYPVIKMNLINFLESFVEGKFNLRIKDFEIAPTGIDKVLDTTEKEVNDLTSGLAESNTQKKNDLDLNSLPDSIRKIADIEKRKAAIEINPEGFLLFLFGQLEKYLRILYFTNASDTPRHRGRNMYNVRNYADFLFRNGLIDKDFFDVFNKVILIRNSIAHGEQLDESDQDKVKNICDRLSEYLVIEYLRNKDTVEKYWNLKIDDFVSLSNS